MGLEPLLPPALGSVLIGRESWDGRLVFTAAVAVLLPFILTYLYTSLSANLARNGDDKGAPPPVPYAVPLLGNTFQFAYDTEGFLARTL